MCFQLEGQEDHRQALARPLGVPDQPLLELAVSDPLNRLVDRPELLIAADFLDLLLGVGIDLENDEMGQQVQQTGWLQQAP